MGKYIEDDRNVDLYHFLNVLKKQLWKVVIISLLLGTVFTAYKYISGNKNEYANQWMQYSAVGNLFIKGEQTLRADERYIDYRADSGPILKSNDFLQQVADKLNLNISGNALSSMLSTKDGGEHMLEVTLIGNKDAGLEEILTCILEEAVLEIPKTLDGATNLKVSGEAYLIEETKELNRVLVYSINYGITAAAWAFILICLGIFAKDAFEQLYRDA